MSATPMKVYPQDRRKSTQEERERYAQEHPAAAPAVPPPSNTNSKPTTSVLTWLLGFLGVISTTAVTGIFLRVEKKADKTEERVTALEKRLDVFGVSQANVVTEVQGLKAEQRATRERAEGNTALLEEIADAVGGRPASVATKRRRVVREENDGPPAPARVEICHWGPAEGSDKPVKWPLILPASEAAQHLRAHVNDTVGGCQ